MKNEYRYNNGKIIALDDKLGQIEYEYHDEIDEELITENLIEQIQISLESAKYALGCQETIKKEKYTKNKRYIRYILNVLIPSITIETLFMLLTTELYIAGMSTMLGIISGIALNKFDKEQFTKVQNRINALLVQIGELNGKLKTENKKLINIRNNKKRKLNQQPKSDNFKINNSDKLQDLSKLESLWYQAGYFINDYYDFEQKGNLRHMLHDEYAHKGEFDEVERITKTYGPVLTKKHTPPRNAGNK